MPKILQLEPNGESLRQLVIYLREFALAQKLPLPYQVEGTDANDQVLWSAELSKEGNAFSITVRQAHPERGRIERLAFPLTVRLEAKDGTVLRVSVDEDAVRPALSA